MYYHYKLQTTNSTKLSFSKALQTIHKPQDYTGEYKYKLQASDYQVET